MYTRGPATWAAPLGWTCVTGVSLMGPGGADDQEAMFGLLSRSFRGSGMQVVPP